MNKASKPQHNSKRSLSGKANKLNKRKAKKVQKVSKRSMGIVSHHSARVVPGTSPTWYSSPDREEHIQAMQHSRDLSSLQTQQRADSIASILASNNYVPKMVLSGDLSQAKANTRAFYRKILRLTPGLVAAFNMYELNPKSLVGVIRSQFDQHGVITSPQVMDSLRWEAEMQFTDIVRLYYTESHVFGTLFPDLHFAMLPKLPAAALPATHDKVQTALEYDSSPFLQRFLDPTIEQRELRAQSSQPGYTHV